VVVVEEEEEEEEEEEIRRYVFPPSTRGNASAKPWFQTEYLFVRRLLTMVVLTWASPCL